MLEVPHVSDIPGTAQANKIVGHGPGQSGYGRIAFGALRKIRNRYAHGGSIVSHLYGRKVIVFQLLPLRVAAAALRPQADQVLSD